MANVQDIIKSSGSIPHCKKILKNDCLTQLEGIYGLLQSGDFEDISLLPNIKPGSSDMMVRQELEKFVSNHVASGLDKTQAVGLLIKEYAFTYLNRFVALKMMEERKIIRQSFSRGYESNNYKFWLADHPEQEAKWRKGNFYESYQEFLLNLFTLISRDEEIKLLFDPSSVYSILFPAELTLKNLFSALNDESLSTIWKEDETIGWVYQYFIEDEKEQVFDKIYQKKKKLDLRDIPAATQIFTPKWIVKWIVENTLGRLWMRMHPDSDLISKMNYYVPNDQDKNHIPLKPVSKITLLDPACGTMHFGMYGFDLFYEMYLEELNNAGKPGWPAKASVNSVEDIPRVIIENNLFGIDIDLRAIQLSALSLYLKAKSKNKDVVLSKYNLACTDIPPFSEGAIKAFVDEITVKHPITRRLLHLILPMLNKAYYLGSLLKIEEVVDSFVDKEKASLKTSLQLDLFSGKPSNAQTELDLFIEKQIIWDDVRAELHEALYRFSELNKEQLGGFLAGQSVKGLNLIDALIRKHDVVVANPPFSGRRNWSKQLNKDLKEFYDKSAGDLYSCFISRCLDLAMKNGFVGMITIHSFMFTSSFEKLRQTIIENHTIESLVHLGPTFMELSNPYAQQCAMYSFQKSAPPINATGIYFRVINFLYNEKEIYYLSLLKGFKKQKFNLAITLKQQKFQDIPLFPFVYWINDRIRSLFYYKKISDYYIPCVGLQTGNNSRFLRLWWEIGLDRMLLNCRSKAECMESSYKWFPYMKGGEVRKWYGNQEYVVNWFNDGDEIRNYYKKGKLASRPQNQKYYFSEGITYSYLTISDLSVRLMPSGFIFDVSGSSIFSNNFDIYFCLGLLSSKISTFLIKLINPTVSYQVGDLARLPMPPLDGKQTKIDKIVDLVKSAISLQKQNIVQDENSWEFEKPPAWNNGFLEILTREKKLTEYYSEISALFYELFQLHEDDIVQIESEFGKLPGKLENVPDLNDAKLLSIADLFLNKHVPSAVLKQGSLVIEDDESDESADVEEEADEKGKRKKMRFLTFEEICLASGFHPETVYNYIVANKLEREEERYELAVRWISYAIGIVMGRFQVEGILADDDGICALDEGHPDDFPKLVFEVLLKAMGEKDANEVVSVINGQGSDKPVFVLRKFLEKDFFTKWHIPMYKKRPVYWLLQSRKRNYGLYLYNQKFSDEALYAIVQKYINSKLKLERTRIDELTEKIGSVSLPSEKRKFENELAKTEEIIMEIEQFKKDVQEVIELDFKPDIDDGVILNMAPLYKLIPSWREPEVFYKKLQEGEFEWSTVSKSLFQ